MKNKKRYDPLLFEDLRAQIDFALERTGAPEVAATLATATRRILELDVGHASISRACAALGWRAELSSALSRELATAVESPDAEGLAALGQRIASEYAAHLDEVPALVALTSERLGEPAAVVGVAIALAGHGPAGASAPLARAVDAAIEAERRVRADEVLATGAGIVHALVGEIATRPGCAAVHGIADGEDAEPRAECAERIEAWLVGWLEEQGSSHALPAASRGALLGWGARALALLPGSDVAVRNAVRAIAHLPDEAGRVHGWLAILGAALPGAVRSRAAVVVRHAPELARALVVEGRGIARLEGGADLEESLPVDARAPFRAAARRWQLAGGRSGVVRWGEGTCTMALLSALPGIDVSVGAERCMGDTRYSITVSGPEAGATLTLLDESPELVAIDRQGRGVWIQGLDARGARRAELRPLGRHAPPPWPAHPPRAAAALVTELLGPRCPGAGSAVVRFAFAEDAESGA